MGITIDMPGASATRSTLKADRRLWLNADKSAIVEDGDPAAAHLLASGPGKPIPHDITDQLGLVADADGRIAQPGVTAQLVDPAPPVDDDAAAAPVDDQATGDAGGDDTDTKGDADVAATTDAPAPADDAKGKQPDADKARKPKGDKQKKGGRSK